MSTILERKRQRVRTRQDQGFGDPGDVDLAVDRRNRP
jgi:hypothetical protein